MKDFPVRTSRTLRPKMSRSFHVHPRYLCSVYTYAWFEVHAACVTLCVGQIRVQLLFAFTPFMAACGRLGKP